MYPAALHKIPTQTVDLSQFVERLNCPKASKDDQKSNKKLGQKHNQRSGTGLSQTGPRFSLLIVIVEDNLT